MIHAQLSKIMPLVAATAATSATASAQASVVGFHYAQITAVLPKASATNVSAIWGVLKVQGGNAASGAWTDIIGGTTNTTAAATEFVMAVHNDTSVPQATRIYVDLIKNPWSNLNVVYQSAASNSTVGISIELFRGDAAANTAAQKGVGAFGVS